MATLRDEIQSLLKTGYTLVDNRVLNANGKVVRDKTSGQPINVKGASSWHYRRRILGQLNTAGVLRPMRPARSQHTPRTSSPRERKNPLLLAAEILRDPDSSPRERGMARAYNELFQTHQRVKALAQALGRELKERGE